MWRIQIRRAFRYNHSTSIDLQGVRFWRIRIQHTTSTQLQDRITNRQCLQGAGESQYKLLGPGGGEKEAGGPTRLCMLIKGPTRCSSMQTFIYCRVTLHVSGVTAPIIRSTKNCICYLWYKSCGTVTSFHRGLIGTVPIRPRWKEVTVPHDLNQR